MSVTRTAYDASLDKFVSLVVYRDSRRFENQRCLRDLFCCLARFDFGSSKLCSGIIGSLGGRLGTVWKLLPPSN